MTLDLTLADKLHELTYHPYKNFEKPVDLKRNHKLYAQLMQNMLELRMKLRAAKRFVLDDVFVTSAVKQSMQHPDVIARYSQLAFLPFPVIWVEYNGYIRNLAQYDIGTSPDLFDPLKGRCGFLLSREKALTEHPTWVATYVAEQQDTKHAWLAPIQYRLRCPTKTMPPEGFLMGHIAWGYRVDGKGPAITPNLKDLCSVDADPYFIYPYRNVDRKRLDEIIKQFVHEGRGDMRWLVTMLTMINHVPVNYVNVPVQTSRVVKLKHVPMLGYSTLQIVAGAPHNINLAGQPSLPTGIHRRQHDVRGFNRVLHRGTPRERTTWVKEHKRGDPLLGIVTHDYEVVR